MVFLSFTKVQLNQTKAPKEKNPSRLAKEKRNSIQSTSSPKSIWSCTTYEAHLTPARKHEKILARAPEIKKAESNNEKTKETPILDMRL
jgi:hypothetical protein